MTSENRKTVPVILSPRDLGMFLFVACTLLTVLWVFYLEPKDSVPFNRSLLAPVGKRPIDVFVVPMRTRLPRLTSACDWLVDVLVPDFLSRAVSAALTTTAQTLRAVGSHMLGKFLRVVLGASLVGAAVMVRRHYVTCGVVKQPAHTLHAHLRRSHTNTKPIADADQHERQGGDEATEYEPETREGGHKAGRHRGIFRV